MEARRIFDNEQQKTNRRELRRDIRRALGTSSDSPPSAISAVRAARYLDELLRISNGMRIKLVSADGREWTPAERIAAHTRFMESERSN